MPKPLDCNQNTDPLKLVRDGVNQEQRLSAPLDPLYVPVNEHNEAHGMIFAQALSAFVNYFDTNNKENGTWTPFFSNDPSLRLAVASVQNLEDYKSQLKSYFDFLNNLDNELKNSELKNNLSYIFSCLASLAKQLDLLKEGLPVEIALKATLKNLVTSQLAPAFQRMIAYRKAGVTLLVIDDIVPPDSIKFWVLCRINVEIFLASGFRTTG